MTEREYQKAMECFTPGPGLRARVQAAAERAEKPRVRVRPLRTVLIAAAVCLALVGTAFAATAVYRLTVQTGEWENWGNEYVGYRVYGEPVLHPLEDFSQKLQDDFAAWDHPNLLFNQKFGSWEEVEAYLGDNIPIAWHGIDSIDADEYPPEYRVQGFHEMYGDNKLQSVEVIDNGVYINDKLSFHTEIYIYTSDYRGEFLTGEGLWKDCADFQPLDSYTMANGCVAEVVVVAETFEGFEGEAHRYIGTFMKDGILYKADLFVPIQYPAGKAELEEQLHQILDSFQ